mgnify:CR=1 FL=1
MKKIVVGNWKMMGHASMAHPLVQAVAGCAGGAEVILCPPATLLAQVKTWLAGSDIGLGGQDCSGQPDGAYTGDISAAMLK